MLYIRKSIWKRMCITLLIFFLFCMDLKILPVAVFLGRKRFLWHCESVLIASGSFFQCWNSTFVHGTPCLKCLHTTWHYTRHMYNMSPFLYLQPDPYPAQQHCFCLFVCFVVFCKVKWAANYVFFFLQESQSTVVALFKSTKGVVEFLNAFIQ